ncbi:MAG: response regulator [Myxococcales bacterium]|nr:response regulator [Myxococcales bacterium]
MPDETKTLVLVADDEPSTRALVVGHLKRRGYRVVEATDGDEAWTLAHEHLPDLVVLDVMMPGMSGWEVCRKIREAVSLAHTGVVMLTGIGEHLNEMTSPLYGADAYLDKPFEFSMLDARVQETLARRRAGQVGRGDSPNAGTPKKAKAAKPAAKKAAPKKNAENAENAENAKSAKSAKKNPKKSAKKGKVVEAKAAAPSKKAKVAKPSKTAKQAPKAKKTAKPAKPAPKAKKTAKRAKPAKPTPKAKKTAKRAKPAKQAPKAKKTAKRAKPAKPAPKRKKK